MQDQSYIGPSIESQINVLDYADVPDVEVSWLWKPFIPFGDVTIVEGDGMAGKTTALIRLACMCSKGEVPPSVEHGELSEEEKHTSPFHILYVGVEANNETEIKPAIKYGKGDVNYFHFLDQSQTQFVLTEPFVREAIRQSQCKLLIVDPYTNFLPSGYGLGNAVSMRRLLTTLMNIARDTGVAIVLVGHLSKNPYGKAIYAGYGSADIINTVRSVLLVSRDDLGIHYLRILKSNYFGVDAFFRVGLSMDDENCVHFEDYNYLVQQYKEENRELSEISTLETAPEDVKQKLSRTAQCAILIKDTLEEGAMTRSDLYEAIGNQGFSDRTISRAFASLNGQSYYVGRTVWWKLPEGSADEESEE